MLSFEDDRTATPALQPAIGNGAGSGTPPIPASLLKSTPRPSVTSSEMAVTASVFITLWISGTCLSPMPWMLCSPKPL